MVTELGFNRKVVVVAKQPKDVIDETLKQVLGEYAGNHCVVMNREVWFFFVVGRLLLYLLCGLSCDRAIALCCSKY